MEQGSILTLSCSACNWTMQLEMGSAPASGAVNRALAVHIGAQKQPTV